MESLEYVEETGIGHQRGIENVLQALDRGKGDPDVKGLYVMATHSLTDIKRFLGEADLAINRILDRGVKP